MTNNIKTNRYCAKCGGIIPPGSNICPACGWSTGPSPKKGSAGKWIAISIAIIAIVVFSIIALSYLGNNSDNDGDDWNPYTPKPDIRYVSGTFEQETLSGDVIVHAKVTNLGDAIGSKTIVIEIEESSGTYTNSKYVTLAPGETVTVDIRVNTPFGTGVNSNMIDVYLT